METYRIHIFLLLTQFFFYLHSTGRNFIGDCETKHGNRSSLSHPDTIILKDFLIYVHFSFNDWTKFFFFLFVAFSHASMEPESRGDFFQGEKNTRLIQSTEKEKLK